MRKVRAANSVCRPVVAVLVGHPLVAAAAVTMVVWSMVAGTRPNAELEGLYFLFGLVLATPVLWFTVEAVRCVLLISKDRSATLIGSVVLGVVETLLGAVFVFAVTRSSAPLLSQPVIGVAVVLLLMGPTAVAITVRHNRRVKHEWKLSLH